MTSESAYSTAKRLFTESKNSRNWEDFEDEVGEIDPLQVQPDINREIWDENDEPNPEINNRLLEIAAEFMEGLEADVDIVDVHLTGSLAGYMWNAQSDVDLHILVDFKKSGYDEDVLKGYFNSAKGLWNEQHDIRIKDFEVEVYVQDTAEEHEASGIYSLLDGKWIQEPKKAPELDRANIEKKADDIARQIGDAQEMYDAGEYEMARDNAQRIADKLKKMRQAGLDDIGIYSVENMAFKLLRREGELEKLSNIKVGAHDKALSINGDDQEIPK